MLLPGDILISPNDDILDADGKISFEEQVERGEYIACAVFYLLRTIRNTFVTLEKAVLEERLIKTENAERAKTMFLSNMSHDIRTPMNAIIGYSTLAVTNIDNKAHVLLVEDNELNREIATEILTESGFLVEAAADGYYDMILMDVQMPVVNGYEATKAIRKLENPKLANISIAKPLDLEQLFGVLHKYLGKNTDAQKNDTVRRIGT